jgi:hypothetical protein
MAGFVTLECVTAMPQFSTEFAEGPVIPLFAHIEAGILADGHGRRAEGVCGGVRCGAAGHVCLCERARDVVLRDVLPGPGCRVRAAGEIGEFAGARGRAPRFGAALAAIGAKGQSDAPRPRA